MIGRGRGRPQILVNINVPRRYPQRYAKKWDKDFSKRRGFGEKAVPQVDELEEIGAHEVDLTIILRTFKGEVPSYKVKFIQSFCQEAPPTSPESTNSEITEEEPQAWIDDRDSFTALARDNPLWLNADGLYAHLKLPRFGSDGQPNADRRLICVKNLGASYIRAIAETASFHQIETLREAFWNYLALKASLKVKICAIGFKTFSLEINMPYLALRHFRTPLSDRLGKPMRKRIDLSFLNIPTHANDGNGTYGLQEAQISLSIIGVDHYNWTCYCFVDTDIGGPFPDDEDSEDEEEDPDDETIEPMKEDPIVCDDDQEEVQDAHSPVWDPRKYFVLAVDARMKQILREWENAVYEVEARANYWMDTHPFTLSSSHLKFPGANVEKDFDWIVEMIVLLRCLLGHLSETTRVWERFVASDGDIGYFSDIKEPPTRQRLDRIRKVFDDLIGLRETLQKLNNSYETRKGNLELLLNLEGNQLSRAGNDLNFKSSLISLKSHKIGLETVKVSFQNHKLARFALMMSQILAPVGIVVAYFGTQNNIFLFDRNSRSFVISLFVVTIGFNLIGLLIFMIGRCGWLKGIIDMLEQSSKQRRGSVGCHSQSLHRADADFRSFWADENNIGITSSLSQDLEMVYLDGEARRREFGR